jgi:hypothetical protein
MIKTIGIPVSLVPGFLSYSHREPQNKATSTFGFTIHHFLALLKKI